MFQNIGSRKLGVLVKLCNLRDLLFPSFPILGFLIFTISNSETNLGKACKPFLRFSDSEFSYFPIPKSKNWEFENSQSL